MRKDYSESLLSVLSVIDKHEVQGMVGLIFTNIFKNKLLWSVTLAGTGCTPYNTTSFTGYL